MTAVCRRFGDRGKGWQQRGRGEGVVAQRGDSLKLFGWLFSPIYTSHSPPPDTSTNSQTPTWLPSSSDGRVGNVQWLQGMLGSRRDCVPMRMNGIQMNRSMSLCCSTVIILAAKIIASVFELGRQDWSIYILIQVDIYYV